MSASHSYSPEKLNDQLVQAIAETGDIRHFPAKAIFINEGDHSDSLYIILSGKVKVYSVSESGKELIFNVHGAGDYIGEMSLDGEPRSASAMTLEPTTCSVVNGKQLREFISLHPDFAIHLIYKLIRRSRVVSENLKSLALLDVYGRIARLLLELAETEGDKMVIRQKLTHQDIADRVGSSREMVSRILKDLTAGGYLSMQEKIITMHKKPPPGW
ncbi:MAG: Crp/Fnr family transcriptional regulator [Burkholderiales bacterium]